MTQIESTAWELQVRASEIDVSISDNSNDRTRQFLKSRLRQPSTHLSEGVDSRHLWGHRIWVGGHDGGNRGTVGVETLSHHAHKHVFRRDNAG